MRKVSAQPLPRSRVRRTAILTLQSLLIRILGTSWSITTERRGSPSFERPLSTPISKPSRRMS
jgi:hypothetical protein